MPLEVRHNGNYPIEWYTDSIGRMRLSPSVTGPMGPGDPFPGVNRDGYLLLTGVPAALTDPNCRAPFTRLHLVDQEIPTTPNNYAQQQGFRPWQRNGITLTGNNDQSYIGHKYNGTDVTDLVVQWSDNPDSSPYGTDRMKFVFTTLYNAGAAKGAATMQGLEAMRLYPATYEEVHVGIGDFAQTGLAEPDPTERLDLLDRTIRLRRIIPDYNNDTLSRVVMVDSTGRLHWRRIDTFPTGSGADCDWVVLPGSAPGDNRMSTAYGAANPDCPDETEAVGIGLDLGAIAPAAKLEVYTNRFGIGERVVNETSDVTVYGLAVHAENAKDFQRGISVEAFADDIEINYGLHADVTGATYRSRGVSAQTSGAKFTAYAGEFIADDNADYTTGAIGWARGGKLRIGLDGRSIGTHHTQQTGVNGWGMATNGCAENMATLIAAPFIGVSGIACRDEESINAVGVYGRSVQVVTNETWAGYFDGNVNINGTASCTASAWTSDGNLKTNVESLTNASELIAQLQPKTYDFDVASHPVINLPEGLQRGFIAQELEQVLPDLVSEVTYLGQVDSTGTEVTPGETVKAVNYIGLIPVMVAAMQEQTARIAQLEQQLASCCSSGMVLQDPDAATGQAEGTEDMPAFGAERALRIVPNPFVDRTTLYFSLERAGRAQLLANSADGRDLRVLSEAQREPGDYQHEWDTTGLAPGVYYVTLLLDGEPVVKRAVKVQR